LSRAQVNPVGCFITGSNVASALNEHFKSKSLYPYNCRQSSGNR
jgi:hypothetical protein